MFTQKTYIKVETQEEFKDIAKELEKLGYEQWECCSQVSNFYKYLTNFDAGKKDKCNYNYYLTDVNNVSDCITANSKEEFLAYAAMTDEKDGIAGEYWKCIKEFSYFTVNNLYKAILPINNRKSLIDNEGDKDGCYDNNHSYFIKATKEEIQNHFNNIKNMEQTNEKQKEIIKYVVKPEFQTFYNKLFGYNEFNKGSYFIIKSNAYEILLKAKVLDIWCNPIYKEEPIIIEMGGWNGEFKLSINDKKVYYNHENITNFVKDLVQSFDKDGFKVDDKYNVIVEKLNEIYFSKTGCQNVKTSLTQWRKVYNLIKD